VYVQIAKLYLGTWTAEDWPSLRQFAGANESLVSTLRRLVSLGRDRAVRELPSPALADVPERHAEGLG
jgi:hypothetical protein